MVDHPNRYQTWPPPILKIANLTEKSSIFIKKSSPLKPLSLFKPNLIRIILRGFALKIMFDDPANPPTWQLLLKIEHRGKINKKNQY